MHTVDRLTRGQPIVCCLNVSKVASQRVLKLPKSRHFVSNVGVKQKKVAPWNKNQIIKKTYY